MPRLSVSLIADGRYWKAGDEVPLEQLPLFAVQNIVSESGNGGASAPAPTAPPQGRSRTGRWQSRSPSTQNSGPAAPAAAAGIALMRSEYQAAATSFKAVASI